MKHFAGVASPLTEEIEAWADKTMAPPPPASRLFGKPAPMQAQAQRVSDWLNSILDPKMPPVMAPSTSALLVE